MGFKLIGRTMFPALVSATSPLTLSKSGLSYTFGIDVSLLLNSITVSFANITGNISVSQMNSGTGASVSTFWRGDGTWAAVAAAGTPSPIFDYLNFS